MEKNPSHPEESSWTFYIQEFMHQDSCCFSSEVETPSLVSDAASSAVHKLEFQSNQIKPAKQTSFKKKVLPAVDYELEDTASSPVNTPKACYVKGQREKGQIMNDPAADHGQVMMMRRNVMTFGRGVERELRKRSP